MKINWMGHASFLINFKDKKLITDPFDENLGYPVFKQEVDIATVSHEHWDHNAIHLLNGNPEVIKETGIFNIKGINIKGIASYHDKVQGKDRGENIIFKISAEDIDLVHLGDLGHMLNHGQVNEIGNVDVLLIPVGGIFTIDAEEAFKVVNQLNPRIIIPMHFKTPHLCFELAPVEAFTARFDSMIKRPYLEVTRENINNLPRVIVLDYLHEE